MRTWTDILPPQIVCQIYFTCYCFWQLGSYLDVFNWIKGNMKYMSFSSFLKSERKISGGFSEVDVIRFNRLFHLFLLPTLKYTHFHDCTELLLWCISRFILGPFLNNILTYFPSVFETQTIARCRFPLCLQKILNTLWNLKKHPSFL